MRPGIEKKKSRSRSLWISRKLWRLFEFSMLHISRDIWKGKDRHSQTQEV